MKTQEFVWWIRGFLACMAASTDENKSSTLRTAFESWASQLTESNPRNGPNTLGRFGEESSGNDIAVPD